MFGNNKKSKSSNKKNVKTDNNTSTQNAKHNNSRTVNTNASRGSKILPDLPDRNSRNRESGGYSSYYSYGNNRDSRSSNTSTTASRSRYSSENSRNTSTRNNYSSNYYNSYYNEGENRQESTDNSKSKKNTNTKKKSNKKNVIRLAGGLAGGMVKSVKGGKVSNAKIINNQTVSAKRNSIALPIFIFFIILCFIYIIGSSVNFLTKKIVSYDILAYGTIDTPKSANAIIVRSEKVYNTEKAGVISYDIADNERVKKNTVVCSIKDEAVVAQMQETLDGINEQIMKIQSERKDISVYSEDIKKYNALMKSNIDDSAMDYAYMKLGNIYELDNTLKNNLDTRNQYLLTENSDVLSDLVSQKKEQESKLNENISNVVADESGIVSYYIDGLEEEITPDNMADIKKTTIADTVKAQSSFRSSVKANSPAFKLVTSNIWYIVTYINEEYVKDWEQGDIHSIYIKDDTGREHKLDCSVMEIASKDNEKEKFLILKATRDITDFINNRNITIETESSRRGFKVPNDAIVEETLMKIPTDYVDADGNVLKVENGTSKKISVNVSGKDPDDSKFSYTPVQLGIINVGDTIKAIDSDETFVIADVLNTKGIYIINTGIAEFKTINLTNSTANTTHTILDPSYNTNIYVYDRIMSDPRTVQKQDMVYE